jgi:hypothetical protein
MTTTPFEPGPHQPDPSEPVDPDGPLVDPDPDVVPSQPDPTGPGPVDPDIPPPG